MASCQHLTPTSHSPSRGSGQPPPEVRGGTRGDRNAWETGATTRGYEVSEDGTRVSLLVRLRESTPGSRQSLHGLSDTTTSDLHKSQPYSDLLRQTLGFSVPRPVVTIHDFGSLGLFLPRSTSASTRLASRSPCTALTRP